MSLTPLLPPKLLKIVEYPAEILLTKCAPILEITEEFKRLSRDMLHTLLSTPGGIGLSAPQVGVPARLLVIAVPGRIPLIMFNPKVRRCAPSFLTKQEGCLSFPGVVVNKTRPKWVGISYQNAQGVTIHRKLHGMESTCFQHEFNHLDGTLFK